MQIMISEKLHLLWGDAKMLMLLNLELVVSAYSKTYGGVIFQ